MYMQRKRATASSVAHELQGSEKGVGLIEILISMLLLALLATALVPVLLGGLKQATSSATLATATQLANDELERARTWSRCSQVTPGSFTITDTRNVQLSVTSTATSCSPSTENPVSVRVTVVVKRLDTNVVITSTATNLFIAEL